MKIKISLPSRPWQVYLIHMYRKCDLTATMESSVETSSISGINTVTAQPFFVQG